MKVVEVDPIHENDKEQCTCFVIERFLSWFVILFLLFMLTLFFIENLHTMHLKNRIMENGFEDLLQRKHAIYRKSPPLWMP